MSIHLNLKEVKILKVNVHKEKNTDLVYKGKITEETKNFFGFNKTKIVSEEGWYDSDGFKQKSKTNVEYGIASKKVKIVNGELYYTARIGIETTNSTFLEFFDSNIELEARLEEITNAAKCDFFEIKND